MSKHPDGITTPALIHNGHYFYVQLKIYADGIVDCWSRCTLDEFAGKLAEGWVEPGVPDGEEICIHGLGDFMVSGGTWKHDTSTFLEHVRSLVPHAAGNRVTRDRVSLFANIDGVTYLADLRARPDAGLELADIPSPQRLDLAAVMDAVADGRFTSTVPAGTRVTIHGLGSFAATAERSNDIQEVLREVPDLIDRASGRPDSVDRCRKICRAYEEDPSEELREQLRLAYEAIPEHNRMYVGDMDTKDIAVRMIIYGDEELENWSHRRIARIVGSELPTITVPKPKK